MQPSRVEDVQGSGWGLTTLFAALFAGGCWVSVRAWSIPESMGVRIAIMFVTLCFALLVPVGLRHVRRARRQARRHAEVLATGLRTVATVTAVTQTRAGGDGYDPTVRLTLRVMAPDGRSRSAWVSYLMPVPMIVAIRPGTQLPVILDVDDPRSAVVDWNSWQ